MIFRPRSGSILEDLCIEIGYHVINWLLSRLGMIHSDTQFGLDTTAMSSNDYEYPTARTSHGYIIF